MSWQAVEWAMERAPMLLTDKGKPDTTSRHVLAVLAEYAEPDGTDARPALIRIQYRSGYDRRTVQRALRRLEVGGLITAGGVKFGCTIYRLSVGLQRPESDMAELEAGEERQRESDAERQRRSRSKRVTHSNDVTVTDAESVTGRDVTHADDVSHALSVPTSRTQNPDVTDATPPNPSFDPPGFPPLSSNATERTAPAAPVEDEREIDPILKKITDDHGATQAEATALLAQVRLEGQVGNLVGWASSATGRLDIKQRLYELRSTAWASPAGSGLPSWCGHCGDGNSAARTNPRFRTIWFDDTEMPCPQCHPDSVAA